ncbi:unnamed protein product [Acanthocheilonema viteae]|uniref:Uncharacterized protein n=1 Tax=Acanthocheilonema viteae TaxID=6277 RepID=A0A498SRZ5_ACAVI|nr:unnamed protein product [Acanthocheilonema viteae]
MEIGRRPELVPMVVIQDDREIPLALIANHELVALPRQVFPIEEVEWPEFATIGRSIEGRILSAPPWIREFTNPAVKKIALSMQRFGRDREGFAVIKEYIKRGVILTPIDEEDKKICGDLFFPYEMRIDVSRAVTKYEDVYRLGSKWYFRACPELPNRKYKYRVYSLNSLDDVLSGNLITQERSYEQTVITKQDSVTVDVSTSVMHAVASTNCELDDSHQLIEFDSEPLQIVSPNSSLPKAATVSPVTSNSFSNVNFDTSPAATARHINETMVLQSSNSSDMAGCNLLVDLNVVDEVQQVATQVRHFHVLDEDFSLSSLNFDFDEAKKCNYKAEMFSHNNHENNEDMCMASQIKDSGSADLNRIINGFNKPKELMKVEDDCAIEFAACKPKKCVENCSTLCNGNSEVEQLIDMNNDSPITDQKVDTSDDDSENEVFHAVPVERQNDDGWWFTRRDSNKTDSMEDKKINDEFMRLPCCIAENSETAELNSVPDDDKPLLILTGDQAKNCETTSLTTTSQISLSNTLQNDGYVNNYQFMEYLPQFALIFLTVSFILHIVGSASVHIGVFFVEKLTWSSKVYAKFFAGLLRK